MLSPEIVKSTSQNGNLVMGIITYYLLVNTCSDNIFHLIL